MKTIIIDTNFLLIPGTLNVDIFEEIQKIMSEKYTLCILDKTLEEMDKIIKTEKLKFRSAAKLGLSLAKNKEIQVISTNSELYVDDLLLEMAKSNQDIIVATQDFALKRLLNNEKIQVIFLRQKKYLKKE